MKKAILICGALLVCTPFAHAQRRPMGPSARAAARLAKAPPLNWIAMYLPQDRYKVAGRVWKVVASDVGRSYHLPWSAPILSQLRRNPGGVIGFASAREAEEAGYEAGSDVVAAGVTVEPLPGAPIQREREVVLSDGASTVLLPGNWVHLPLGAQSGTQGAAGQMNLALDLLMTSDQKYLAMFMRIQAPGKNVVGSVVSPQNLSMLSRFGGASGGTISNANSFGNGNWLRQAKISPVTFGGLRGSSISPPPSAASTAVGNLIMVGRGDKAYMFVVMRRPGADARPSRVPGLGTIVKTMRLG